MSKLGDIGWVAPNANPGDKLPHAEIDGAMIFSEGDKILLTAFPNMGQVITLGTDVCSAGLSVEKEVMGEILEKLKLHDHEKRHVEKIVRPVIEKLVVNHDFAYQSWKRWEGKFKKEFDMARTLEGENDKLKDRIDELEMALSEGEKNSVSSADYKEVEIDRDNLSREVIFQINAYKEEHAKCNAMEECVEWMRSCGYHRISCRSHEAINGVSMRCTCGKDEALAKLDALKGGAE